MLSPEEEEEDAHADTTSTQMPLPQDTLTEDELLQKRHKVENIGPMKPEDTGVARGNLVTL